MRTLIKYEFLKILRRRSTGITMIGLTLFLSARMKTPYAVLLAVAPILFLSLFLTPGGTSGVYNLTLFLLPYRSLMPEPDKYVSYQIGRLVLDVYTVRAAVYGILALLLLPLAGRGFRKHQISA